MYYVGRIGCPHCDFRGRVCIETDGPAPARAAILVRCPNDDSAHRFPLAGMDLVPECPPDLLPERLEDFEPADTNALRDDRVAFTFAAVGFLGAAALFAAWWLWF